MNCNGILSNVFHGKGGKFAGDLLFRMFAEIANAAFSVIIFGILARQLTKTDYAVSNQLLTFGTLLAPIILVKINSAYCVFFPGEKNISVLKSRFYSSLITIIPILISIITIFIAFRNSIALAMFGTDEYSSYMLVVSLYYVLLALVMLTQDFFRAIASIKISSILISINVFLKVVIFVVLNSTQEAIFLRNVLYVYIGVELLALILGFILVARYFKSVPFKIEFRPLKEYYKYAIPLMPYLLFAWINTSIGKFILNHKLGLENSAIYAFNYGMVSRVFIINTVISYTIFPYLSKFWNEGDKDKVVLYLKKAFNIGLFFGLPISFGLIAVLPTIVFILSGETYQPNSILVLILCFAMIFSMYYNVYAYLISLSRKTIWYTIILLTTSIISVLLNLILIEFFGIYGAAITLMITFTVQALLTVLIGTKSTGLKLSIDYGFVIRTFLISLLMYVFVSQVYHNSTYINFIISILFGIFLYLGLHFLYSKIRKERII